MSGFGPSGPPPADSVASQQIIDDSVASVDIKDGTVVNADISVAAAIARAKLAALPFAQLSDSTNQKPGVTTPVLITFDTNDEIAGITHSETVNPEDITIVEAGQYLIIAQPQVERTSGAAAEAFHMWLRKNTVDVPNSNVELKAFGVGFSDVIALSAVMTLAASDVINVVQSVSVSTNGIGVVATSPAGEPAIPSIICAIVRVG